ncbi:hypothetical protein [uncultured Dysosmobacter sp.]|uniref:hypothetical protein n=1 Tax=uncultured Dysosmobacter sp. TaxID=2591384 RepID=UPI0026351216|nr:hypothetical protein [uncultured Dysosmobacter sp.]
MFQTVDENGKPVNLPTVWGTATVTNEYTKETIASSSDGGNNEDSIYITEHTRDFECGYWYKNTCLVYEYDPYSQPFSDVATAVEYADFYD